MRFTPVPIPLIKAMEKEVKIVNTLGCVAVVCLCGLFNQAQAQEIAICGVGQMNEDWIQSIELEKNSEINLHIDFINRVCDLDDKQLSKMQIAAKMVVGRLINKAKEQQQGMIEPGFAPVLIDEEEAIDQVPAEEGEVDDEMNDGEMVVNDFAVEGDAAVAMPMPALVQVGMVARNDEFSDEEYLYGRSLSRYPLWLKKVDKILTESQRELLAAANKERFQKTFDSVIDRSVSRLSNVLLLNEEQVKQFTELCGEKLKQQITTEFHGNGQVYDYDGMLYSNTTADEVSEFLTEAQLNRWKVLTRHWQVVPMNEPMVAEPMPVDEEE